MPRNLLEWLSLAATMIFISALLFLAHLLNGR